MSNEQNDVLEILRRNQPSVDLLAEWGEEDQRRVLAELLGPEAPTARRFGRKHAVRLGLVAAAAAAVPLALSIGLPGSTPGGPSPAASLERLARIAGVSGPVLGPGQYVEIQSTTTSPYLPGYPLAPGEVRQGDRVRSSSQVWVDREQLWVARPPSETTTSTCLQSFPLTGQVDDSGYDTASAAELATLPTDPGELAAYIDAHPDGGNRGVINRYTAATDILWTGIASPELRSATLNVLAQTPGLSGDEHTTDDQGRPAIRVDHQGQTGIDSVWFDPTTAQVIERSGPAQDGGRYTDVVTSRDVVEKLPDLPACPSQPEVTPSPLG